MSHACKQGFIVKRKEMYPTSNNSGEIDHVSFTTLKEFSIKYTIIFLLLGLRFRHNFANFLLSSPFCVLE